MYKNPTTNQHGSNSYSEVQKRFPHRYSPTPYKYVYYEDTLTPCQYDGIIISI